MQNPALMVAAAHDKQVDPARVRELYDDYGSPQKVMVDLGCASHAAMWDEVHTSLFRASLEWLEKGTVNGQQQGMMRLGYGDHEGK
jgi:esterase/lipase